MTDRTDSWETFGWRSSQIPQKPLSSAERAALELPETLRPALSPWARQRAVFDPALKQHANAYRAADPVFKDARMTAAWRAARRQALDLVLGAIAHSAWADGLVLRGSVLLRTWFGDAAREPGDLDFVVTPTERRIEEPWTAAMLAGIARAAQQAAERDGDRISLRAEEAAEEDIWTYDRVPGRRLLLPWTAPRSPELGGGVVQLDFVFNERLPVAPEPLLVSLSGGDGPGALLQAVTPELSLAWKLMWLLTDMHPQGKDLYDAVLLAERAPLRYEVLRDAWLDADPGEAANAVDADRIAELDLGVEWPHFHAEYPDLPADERELVGRLAAATAPAFADCPDDPYERRVLWLRPRLDRYRALLAAAGMAAAQEQMQADRLQLLAAVVLTRELMGRDQHSVEDASAALLAHPGWAPWLDYKQRNPEWVARQLQL